MPHLHDGCDVIRRQFEKRRDTVERIRRHLQGNLVGYVALFFALSLGTAWALSPNSVTSKTVKNGSIKGADVKDNSLTGADVLESSLSLPAGPVGPEGPQGPQGPAGADAMITPGSVGTNELANGSVS